jgi:16S rRNA (guanine527-N7)-methyltransferase
MIETEADARRWTLGEFELVDAAILDRLIELLRVENECQNLVSANSLEQIWRRHIADSAQLLLHVPRETPLSWIDLGAGAGFPGLVIAALRPDISVTLVESRGRRIEWLHRAAEMLKLRNVDVAGQRLEQMNTQKFDVISARAFAPLPALLEMAARFSTSATIWVLPKGRSAAQELESLVGWSHAFHIQPSITDSDAGVVVGRLHGRKDAPS